MTRRIHTLEFGSDLTNSPICGLSLVEVGLLSSGPSSEHLNEVRFALRTLFFIGTSHKTFYIHKYTGYTGSTQELSNRRQSHVGNYLDRRVPICGSLCTGFEPDVDSATEEVDQRS
jgi:hypothetical protein